MTLGDLYEELTVKNIVIMAYYGFVHVVLAIGIVVKTNRMQARWGCRFGEGGRDMSRQAWVRL